MWPQNKANKGGGVNKIKRVSLKRQITFKNTPNQKDWGEVKESTYQIFEMRSAITIDSTHIR